MDFRPSDGVLGSLLSYNEWLQENVNNIHNNRNETIHSKLRNRQNRDSKGKFCTKQFKDTQNETSSSSTRSVSSEESSSNYDLIKGKNNTPKYSTTIQSNFKNNTNCSNTLNTYNNNNDNNINSRDNNSDKYTNNRKNFNINFENETERMSTIDSLTAPNNINNLIGYVGPGENVDKYALLLQKIRQRGFEPKTLGDVLKSRKKEWAKTQCIHTSAKEDFLRHLKMYKNQFKSYDKTADGWIPKNYEAKRLEKELKQNKDNKSGNKDNDNTTSSNNSNKSNRSRNEYTVDRSKEGLVWSSIIFCPNFRPGGEIVHRYSKRTMKMYNTLYNTIKNGWVHPNLLICLIRDATHPVRFATPPNQDCYTAIYTGPEISENQNNRIVFGEYTGIVYREDSIPDSIFEYAFELNFTSASWVDAELEYRNDKQYIRDMNGTIFLPNNSKYVLDSSNAFNELSMVNHCQSIGAYGGEYFLQANCEWQQVIFDGWPHVILTNKQGVKIQTGDELIADFGALWFQKVEENCHRQLKKELIQYRLTNSNDYNNFCKNYKDEVNEYNNKDVNTTSSNNTNKDNNKDNIMDIEVIDVDDEPSMVNSDMDIDNKNNKDSNDTSNTSNNYEKKKDEKHKENMSKENKNDSNSNNKDLYKTENGDGVVGLDNSKKARYSGYRMLQNELQRKKRFELLRQELPNDKNLDYLDYCVVNNNTSYVCAICLDEDLNNNPNTSTRKILLQRPSIYNKHNENENNIYRDDDDEDECIVCDGCDRIFHTKCLQDVTDTALNYIQMDVYGARYINLSSQSNKPTNYLTRDKENYDSNENRNLEINDDNCSSIDVIPFLAKNNKLDLSLRKWYCMYCRYLCKQIIQHDMNQDFMPLQSCIYITGKEGNKKEDKDTTTSSNNEVDSNSNTDNSKDNSTRNSDTSSNTSKDDNNKSSKSKRKNEESKGMEKKQDKDENKKEDKDTTTSSREDKVKKKSKTSSTRRDYQSTAYLRRRRRKRLQSISRKEVMFKGNRMRSLYRMKSVNKPTTFEIAKHLIRQKILSLNSDKINVGHIRLFGNYTSVASKDYRNNIKNRNIFRINLFNLGLIQHTVHRGYNSDNTTNSNSQNSNITNSNTNSDKDNTNSSTTANNNQEKIELIIIDADNDNNTNSRDNKTRELRDNNNKEENDNDSNSKKKEDKNKSSKSKRKNEESKGMEKKQDKDENKKEDKDTTTSSNLSRLSNITTDVSTTTSYLGSDSNYSNTNQIHYKLQVDNNNTTSSNNSNKDNNSYNVNQENNQVVEKNDTSLVTNVVDYLNCRYLAGMWQLEPFAMFGESVRVCVDCNRKCGPKANVYVCRILKRHLAGNFDHPKATNVEQMRELVLIAYEQHVSFLLRLLVLKNVTIDFLVKLVLHFISHPYYQNRSPNCTFNNTNLTRNRSNTNSKTGNNSSGINTGVSTPYSNKIISITSSINSTPKMNFTTPINRNNMYNSINSNSDNSSNKDNKNTTSTNNSNKDNNDNSNLNFDDIFGTGVLRNGKRRNSRYVEFGELSKSDSDWEVNESALIELSPNTINSLNSSVQTNRARTGLTISNYGNMSRTSSNFNTMGSNTPELRPFNNNSNSQNTNTTNSNSNSDNSSNKDNKNTSNSGNKLNNYNSAMNMNSTVTYFVKNELNKFRKKDKKKNNDKERLSLQVTEFVRAITCNMKRVPHGDGPFNFALLETLGGLEKDFVRLVNCGDICSYINDLASYMCFSTDQVPSNIQQILSKEEIIRFTHFRKHLLKEPGFFNPVPPGLYSNSYFNNYYNGNYNINTGYRDIDYDRDNDNTTSSNNSNKDNRDLDKDKNKRKQQDKESEEDANFVPLLGIKPGKSILYRKFSDGYYQGIVTSYGNYNYFKIEYSDGDDELMDPMELLSELIVNLNNVRSILLQLSSNDIRNYQYLLLLRSHSTNSIAGREKLEQLCTELKTHMLNQLVHSRLHSNKKNRKK